MFTSLHSHFFVGRARTVKVGKDKLGSVTYTSLGSSGYLVRVVNKQRGCLAHALSSTMVRDLTGEDMKKKKTLFSWREEDARNNSIPLSQKRDVELSNGEDVTVVATLTINEVECEGEPSTKKAKL